MIKVEKMALEVVSENNDVINIKYGGLPYTISKKPMEFSGEDRYFSFPKLDTAPRFVTDECKMNTFYDLHISLKDGVADFISADRVEDVKGVRSEEKATFNFIARFPTLYEIFTNNEFFEIAFSHEYQYADSFIDMLEMGAVHLNTVFEGFFFSDWEHFTFEEKTLTTKPMTAREKMVADMAKDGLDFNLPSSWDCYDNPNNCNTDLIVHDFNSPMYAYFISQVNDDKVEYYKRVFPSYKELYEDDEFISRLLECENLRDCQGIVFDWLRGGLNNTETITFPFSLFEVNCGGYDGIAEIYKDDVVVELSEHQKLCKETYDLLVNGYDVDKDFFIDDIKENIVSKDEKGVFRVGEVGLGGHEEDGEIYIDICVYFPNKKEPTYSLDKSFGYLSEDTIKHILENMHKK